MPGQCWPRPRLSQLWALQPVLHVPVSVSGEDGLDDAEAPLTLYSESPGEQGWPEGLCLRAGGHTVACRPALACHLPPYSLQPKDGFTCLNGWGEGEYKKIE